ncbi:MAG: heavy metal translocating P-type ATPase, partial [Gammaproteobacteria bacterium]
PCALSLATPTAVSAATGALLARGLLPLDNHCLETLARATHVVFDKTGTLTHGQPAVNAVERRSELDKPPALAVAAALEQHSEHPAGKAIVAYAGESGHPAVRDIENIPGAGVSGRIDGKRWFIGNAAFVRKRTAAEPETPATPAGTQIFLADDRQVHTVFELQDTLRPDAPAAIAALKRAGKRVLLMSGDNRPATRLVAEAAGIETFHANMTPSDKLARLQALQRQGAVVVMVGDGINDAPVLSAADVSIAMQDAAHISQASADLILLSDRLSVIAAGMSLARRTLRVIRQNLIWAVCYNLVALPAAAVGLVAPWMAAIGMSTSSLLVVLNALRLSRHG